MKRLLPLCLGAALLGACAPSTPQSRIDARPAIYQELDDSEREFVRSGRIRRGMSPDAVYIAWGAPDREFRGSNEEGSTMRWDYVGSRPVYSTNFYGYGYGYGRYSRLGYGFGPDVTYVPYRRATVWFEDGAVSEWEETR